MGALALPLQLIKRLAASRRGNVAMMFGLAAVPLAMAVGMGIDITNAMRVRMSLQDATDSAALALARQAQTLPPGQAQQLALDYVNASYGNYGSMAPVSITNAAVDGETITATVDTKAAVPVFFSRLFGVSTIPVTSHAVARGLQVEIAMVLDTSGSMAQAAGSGGAKIAALKDAADQFLDSLYGDDVASPRVSVSITPFASSVNIGPGQRDKGFMDMAGRSSLAYADFNDQSRTRWQLFDDLNNSSWAGCVISRPPGSDLDVSDAAATNSDPDTLYVPWFAPDEPDVGGGFSNNYIGDAGGTCGTQASQIQASAALRQSNTCKYRNATPRSGLGPNYLCDSQALTPLSNSHPALTNAVAGLKAKGNTNILEGLVWGWRTISPNGPFGGARSYGLANNKKIIVLMTDGQNNYGGAGNMNMSRYASYGFAAKGELGSATSDNTVLSSRIDDRTRKACDNVKAKGIIVYTIAFGADAAGSKALLQSCASDPDYFYAPQNSSDLKPVFLKIAESIKSLRISE